MVNNSNIEKALNILNGYDWYWSLGDDYAYTNGTEKRMEKTMREFVSLAASCSAEVNSALRELWAVSFYYFKGQIYKPATDIEKSEFENKKALLLEIVNSSMAIAA